jgi:outer membrane lipoprotein carrier protein
MSLRPLMLLALAACCVPAFAAGPLAPNEIKALIERIRQKRAAAPQMHADFQEQKRVHLLKQPISSSGKVWFQSPNKFRRETRGNAPSITVSNGQELWIYYPNFKSAEHYSLGARSPLNAGIAAIVAALNLENVERDYHISGSSTGAGYLLELQPRNPSMKRFITRFSIELNPDLQVQRTEMAQPNGDQIVTTYSNETRGPIAPEMFVFKPPAGTDVTTPLGR